MDLDKLYKEILKVKTDTLMEEPCPFYEPEWEDVTDSPKDWEDFWYNEDVSDGCSAKKDQTIGNFREN